MKSRTLSPRKQAQLKGDRLYFTGVGCKNGHLSKRRTANCVCVQCIRQQKSRWRNKHKQARKEKRRFKAYGVTPEQYNAQLKVQQHRCATCGKLLEVGKRTTTDHDHITKRFRGILCSRCNLGIGYFDDSPAVLRKAATYLEQRGVQTMKQLKHVTIEGTFPELKGPRMYQVGRGQGSNIRAAASTAVRDLLKAPGLKAMRFTACKATISFGTVIVEDSNV